jgi:hypothetical protein
MSNNTRACRSCEWFAPVSATRKENDGYYGYGDCRRNPPDANGWPTVDHASWCGEFALCRVPDVPEIPRDNSAGKPS